MSRAPKQPSNALQEVHARLFKEDVETLKQVAAQHGLPWQTELRLLVRRALKGIVSLKEKS